MKNTLIIVLSSLFLGCSMEGKEIANSKHYSGFMLIETTKCMQDSLSKEFDLSFCFQLFESDEQYFYSVIYVHDKQSGLTTDSIFIVSEYMHSDFLNCNNMVSYSTNFKVDRGIVDNHFGDLVVADFNFDGKDDIAVINDRGGNGGPLYSFFLQQENKKFLLDNFLTDSMIFFPSEINSKNKTLTTYVHVGMCGLSERIFKLNGKTNTWIEKSSRLINVCE